MVFKIKRWAFSWSWRHFFRYRQDFLRPRYHFFMLCHSFLRSWVHFSIGARLIWSGGFWFKALLIYAHIFIKYQGTTFLFFRTRYLFFDQPITLKRSISVSTSFILAYTFNQNHTHPPTQPHPFYFFKNSVTFLFKRYIYIY